MTKEIKEALRESYRTLYPLHEAAAKFVQGDNNAFANSCLYNAQLGEIKNYEDEPMRYREAAAAHVQATALDPDNPDALANVERAKLTLGEAQDALEHGLERLRILTKAHGEEPHQDIADCKNCIGLALGALGRHEEALSYQMQALELRKKIFGEQHPDVATSLANLGMTLVQLGRYEEALPYLMQALALGKK